MRNELRFAWCAIRKNIAGSAELRTSFLMNVFGMAINNTAFVIIWLFFVQSVGVINGWGSAEIVGLLGFSAISYGIVFSLATGIFNLSDTIPNGSFDRFLLAPKNLLSRIATSSFRVSAIGDVLFGITCLLVYGIWIQADSMQIVLIIFFIFITSIVFLGVAILVQTLNFLFTDAHSVVDGIFEIFFTPSLFHGGMFQGVMRFIFTFFIPSLLIGTLPVEIIRDLSWGNLLLISVLAFLWFFGSIRFFLWGVKKYESSNLMTFGG